MRKISFQFSPGYRLDLSLVRKHGGDEPLLPNLKELRQTRRGDKISRFFRHVFEHRRIKRILGSNIALAILATSFMPTPIQANSVGEQNIIALEENPVKTQAGPIYPVTKPTINQGFHLFHPGYDFEGVTGDPVYPIMAGVVEKIQYSRFDLGQAIWINHGNQLVTIYAHLSEIKVREGDQITIETEIGKVGATGRATGDHLHFEAHQNGHPINPQTVLPRAK